MKTALTILALAASILSAAAADSANRALAAPRLEQNFNRDFRFRLGDAAGAEKPGFDDAAWECVGLPHSFSIPYFRASAFYVGEGWYRKHFTVPAEWAGRRIRLEFEAAFQHTAVYLNGELAGKHGGGYSGFDIDLTALAKPGDNVLAVRVDNRWDAVLPPRAGEHVFCGGIYRDVRLVVSDPLHIPRNGVCVTTPEVAAARATVKAAVTVKNDGATPRTCMVKVYAYSPDGKTIAAQAQTENRTVAPGETAVFDDCPALTVEKPLLWHPDHPHLYTTVVAVYENGRLVDTAPVRTGLRWFKFTADQGFFLNGEHLRLRGTNAHQDHAGWGDAVTNAGHWRDVKLIKETGMNFIRGSHYPHDPAFLDACDELGILYWSENCFWGIGGFGGDGYWNCSAYPVKPELWQPFEANAKRALTEMIADARNHPSVIIWSMSNEPFFTAGPVMQRARDLASALVKLTHELDPTRPATVGGAQRGGFDKLGDVASYNGDGAGFANPGIPSVVSEYGSHVDYRPGVYDPCWGEVKGKFPEWRSGEALWCAFHHGSIAGDMGRMGMIDHFRLPLRTWYWYRNEYRHIPPPEWPIPGTPAKLKLEADRTTITNDGTEDCQLIVTVLDAAGEPISNSPPVTLTVVSGPGEFPTGPAITFTHGTDIDIREGQAAIEFRSYYGGTTVIRASSPGLEDAMLTVTTNGEPAWSTVKDQTRRVRPYPGPLRPPVAITDRTANLACSRPTACSSQENKNPASGGNDGDPDTRWCAANGALPAWWRVDLENFYMVEEVRIVFEQAGNYRYRVEVSEDDANWTVAVDRSAAAGKEQERMEKFPKPLRARFLRIVYTGVPTRCWPSHREAEVKGTTQKP